MDILRLSGRAMARIKIFSILVLVYSLLLYANPVCAQKDFSALYKKVAPSVVRINVLDTEGKLTSGTGFFIRDDGLVATNYHVIEGSLKAEVRLSNGEIIPIERRIAEDRQTDLALLGLGPIESLTDKKYFGRRFFPSLKFTDTKIEPGQPVIVIGSPFGLEGTISDGIVSAFREIPDVGKIIQITAPISPGSSGSPVLNMKGEVVGVATALVRGGQNLNFAVSVESLDRLLSSSVKEWFEKGLASMESGKYQYYQAISDLDTAIELTQNMHRPITPVELLTASLGISRRQSAVTPKGKNGKEKKNKKRNGLYFMKNW